MGSISIRRIEKSGLEGVDLSNLEFGKVFCDHMLYAHCKNGVWRDAQIVPYGPLAIHPSASVLHYGQAVFEGMKAYKASDGSIQFFRLQDNYKRMNESARRMCMPEIPEEIFVEGLHALVDLDQNWIPPHRESALYLRPFLIATDEFIGVRPSSEYMFAIITCAVNAYYNKALRIKIEDKYIRAAKGGVGEAKAAGNYAGSMFATRLAQEQGYDQLLWTDSKEHKWIEELGTSNFFCVIDNVIVTPLPEGTILRGVTRDSVVQLARHLGMTVEERPLSVKELVKAAEEGRISEAFATGTAAALTPIESISYKDKEYRLSVEGKMRKPLFEELLKIRIGESPDPFGWIDKLKVRREAHT